MFAKSRIVLIIAVLLLYLGASTTYAALLSFGSVDPANGFPAWYQDPTGLSLAPCLDKNGFCSGTMLAAPGFDPALPVVFPTNFPPVGSFFMANAVAGTTLYVAALEFAFATGQPRAGDPMVFARIRIRNAAAPDGAYAVTHPYGVDSVTAAGNGINFTEDIGIAPQNFTAALTGRIGPFLRNAAGLVPSLDGNVYIGDSVTAVPVTGGQGGVNSVTVAGPISGTTSTFILEGKVIGMSVTPASIAFPVQRPGVDSSPVTVTVTNLNAVNNLALASIVSQGSNSADFGIVDVNCLNNGPIAQSGSCTFNVIFNGAAGPTLRNATVIVTATNPLNTPAARVNLTGTIDSVPPIVISTVPGDGQTLPINATITAVFSEPLSTTTVNGTTFTVAGSGGPVAGVVTYDAVNNTAIFIPAAFLASNQTFTATITTGATDIAGNPLAADKTWPFTAVPSDVTPPTIVSVNPPSNATGVMTTDPVTITFSEPMLSTSLTGSVIQVTSGGVPVEGTVTVNGSVAKFTPARPFAFGSAFTVTITTGALDLASNALAAGLAINFLTNFAPTAPVLISPADGEIGLSTTVTLTWNKATDNDGDPLSYKVFVCSNPFFIGCNPNVVTAYAPRLRGIYLAGLGGFVMAVFGLVSIGGIKGGRRILLAFGALFALTGVIIYSCGGGGGGSEGGGDTTPPSVPAGVTATGASATQINLAWTASSDNVGVAGYAVYKEGALHTSATGTAVSVTGLNPATSYCFSVSARDAVGNESGQSDPACATTQRESDTTPPSVPAGVTATAVSATQINLAWAASSDNVGVAGYAVYKEGVLLTSAASGTSVSVTGLTPSTSYCFTVSARDAAGNESGRSDPACATTQSGGVAPANQLSFTVTGLNPVTHYFWKVVADDGKGGTTQSATLSFTTQ